MNRKNKAYDCVFVIKTSIGKYAIYIKNDTAGTCPFKSIVQ